MKKTELKQVIKEEMRKILKEQYIETIDGRGDVLKGLLKIQGAWLEWKDGELTEKEDIKPAQKELINFVIKFLKKNIK